MVRYYLVRIEGEHEPVIVPALLVFRGKTFYPSKKQEEATKKCAHIKPSWNTYAAEIISRHGNSTTHALVNLFF
jgi:hypothetical protein